MQVKTIFSLKLTKVKNISETLSGKVLYKQALSYTIGETVNMFRAISQSPSKFLF